MNMKFEAVPKYETVDILGKSKETTTGTKDRRMIGRCLITLQEGFDADKQVVKGDETPIQTVKEIKKDGEIEEMELFVVLAGGVTSLASFKAYEGYYAKNRENEDVIDLFTTDKNLVDNIKTLASNMCMAHPECANQWAIVCKEGTRVFLREIATDLTETGKINY